MVGILSFPAAEWLAVSIHSLQLLRPMNIFCVVYLLLIAAKWNSTSNSYSLIQSFKMPLVYIYLKYSEFSS